LGSRDQENHGEKPALQIVQGTPSQKFSTQRRAGGVSQMVRMSDQQVRCLEFKPQYCQKKKIQGQEELSPLPLLAENQDGYWQSCPSPLARKGRRSL
jgi:hypothetical protein